MRHPDRYHNCRRTEPIKVLTVNVDIKYITKTILLHIKRPSIPEKLPEKEEVLPKIVEKELISVVAEPSQEDILIIPGPPKPLFQEAEKDDCKEDVSIVPALKVSNFTKPIWGKISLVSYPYELDEVMLVWRQSRQQVDPFLNSEDHVMNQRALRKKVLCNLVLHQDPEKLNDLQVNSR